MHFILFLLLKVLCVVLQFHELSASICFAVFMETNLLKEPAEVSFGGLYQILGTKGDQVAY